MTYFNESELFFAHRGFKVLLYNSDNVTSVICFNAVCSIGHIDKTQVLQLRVRLNLEAMVMKG